MNSKGHAKRLLFFFSRTRSPLRFIYSNVTISAISFLICQSVHTLFDSTSLEVRMSYEEIRLLWSRSQFKTSLNVCQS